MRLLCLSTLICISFPLAAWQQQEEMVFTATTFLKRAETLLEATEYDSALMYCEKAQAKAASLREIYIVRHKIYEAMEAASSLKIKNLKEAQKVSLEDEELAYYIGQIYQNEGKLQEAVSAYSDAIKHSEASDGDLNFRYYYYSGRGVCYLKDRKYKKAAADFTQALEINPENTAALTNRGFCYYNLKDKDKACKDWQAAKGKGYRTAGNYLEKYCN